MFLDLSKVADLGLELGESVSASRVLKLVLASLQHLEVAGMCDVERVDLVLEALRHAVDVVDVVVPPAALEILGIDPVLKEIVISLGKGPDNLIIVFFGLQESREVFAVRLEVDKVDVDQGRFS